MNFSPQQDKALDQVAAWLKTDRQVFTLMGYAGTGKTTLAKHLGADAYAAFTGKAAHVLRSKGCDAQTIHSLIYHPKEKSAERLKELQLELSMLQPGDDPQPLISKISKEKENVRRPSFTLNLDSRLNDCDLLVIDECSMVNTAMGEDLLSFGCKVLVLGDPAQLPPVRGGGFFTERRPDVLLTEIHRQARGNPILDLATRVREGKSIRDHELVIDRKLGPDEALGADQIICGRNRTRHNINARMRNIHKITSSLPVVGDKVVCTRNNHELEIMNGATYTVTDVEWPMIKIDNWLWVTVHPEPFLGEEVDHFTRMDAQQFEYGYALTCHKSQGSQWDDVIVFDESRAFSEPKRWLYTAVTRAAKTLTVVQ